MSTCICLSEYTCAFTLVKMLCMFKTGLFGLNTIENFPGTDSSVIYISIKIACFTIKLK